LLIYLLITLPGRGAQYCVQFVCLSVRLCICLSASIIFGTAGPIFTNFCADPLCPWLGPPLAALRYIYVLSVLWMTSRLAVVARMAMRRATLR